MTNTVSVEQFDYHKDLPAWLITHISAAVETFAFAEIATRVVCIPQNDTGVSCG